MFVASLLASAIVTGCKSGPSDATLHFVATEQLNPNSFGEPSAVTLRIFAIKAPDAFTQAADSDLMADKPALPASAWLEPHKEVTVFTGQEIDVPFEIWPDVRFVGVLGMFEKMTSDSRLLLDSDQAEDSPTLLLDGYTVRLKAEDQEPPPAPQPDSARDEGAAKTDATNGADQQP